MKIKAGNDERVWLFFRNIILIGGLPVSYTHLTLPTT